MRRGGRLTGWGELTRKNLTCGLSPASFVSSWSIAPHGSHHVAQKWHTTCARVNNQSAQGSATERTPFFAVR